MTAGLGAVALPAAPASAATALKCATGYQWYQKGSSVQRRTELPQRNENHSDKTTQATFTSKKAEAVGKQVSVSGEAEVSGGFGPLSASIKATYGVTTTASLTTEVGNDHSAPVPPRRAVEASYGVFRRTFRGVYGRRLKAGEIPPLTPVPAPSNCAKIGFFAVKATLPIGIGWRVRVKKFSQ